MIKRASFSLFCLLTILSLFSLSMFCNTYAEEFQLESYKQPRRWDNNVTKGHIEALVVRVGFADYPVTVDNPISRQFSNDYIRSLFEGKKDGFDLPFNGLSDFLFTSSYGNLSMGIGDIIDIQLDNNYLDYIDDEGFIVYGEYEEFCRKLDLQTSLSKYDYNSDGLIDTLYIFDLSGEKLVRNDGTLINGYCSRLNDSLNNNYVAISSSLGGNDIIRTLIHETGHLIMGLDDYYKFPEYPFGLRADIGDIMGKGLADYDAWSKWKAEWISDENVLWMSLQDSDSGIIELSPYDSDIAEGKKIALIDYGEGIIGVDYCGGINNNAFNNDLRKSGFRFYYIADDFRSIKDIYWDYDPGLIEMSGDGDIFIDVQEGKEPYIGIFSLFSENNEIDDLIRDDLFVLHISNIKEGDTPSFEYYYDNLRSGLSKIRYNVKILDEDGNDLTYEQDTDYSVIKDKNSQNIGLYRQNHDTYSIYYDPEKTNFINHRIKIESLPEGYSIPDEDIEINLSLSDEGEDYLGYKYGSLSLGKENNAVEIIPSVEAITEDDELYFLTVGYGVNITVKRSNEDSISSEERNDSNTDQPNADKQTNNHLDDNSQSTDEPTQRSEEATQPSGEPNQSTNEPMIDVPKSNKKFQNNTVQQVSVENAFYKPAQVSGTVTEATSTGDTNYTALWISLTAAAVATAITAGVVYTRKRKSE